MVGSRSGKHSGSGSATLVNSGDLQCSDLREQWWFIWTLVICVNSGDLCKQWWAVWTVVICVNSGDLVVWTVVIISVCALWTKSKEQCSIYLSQSGSDNPETVPPWFSARILETGEPGGASTHPEPGVGNRWAVEPGRFWGIKVGGFCKPQGCVELKLKLYEMYHFFQICGGLVTYKFVNNSRQTFNVAN